MLDLSNRKTGLGGGRLEAPHIYRKKPVPLPSLQKPSSGTESWLKMGSRLPTPSNPEAQESEPLRLLAELPHPPSWSERDVWERDRTPMAVEVATNTAPGPTVGLRCRQHSAGSRRLCGGEGSVEEARLQLEQPESGEGRN